MDLSGLEHKGLRWMDGGFPEMQNLKIPRVGRPLPFPSSFSRRAQLTGLLLWSPLRLIAVTSQELSHLYLFIFLDVLRGPGMGHSSKKTQTLRIPFSEANKVFLNVNTTI